MCLFRFLITLICINIFYLALCGPTLACSNDDEAWIWLSPITPDSMPRGPIHVAETKNKSVGGNEKKRKTFINIKRVCWIVYLLTDFTEWIESNMFSRLDLFCKINVIVYKSDLFVYKWLTIRLLTSVQGPALWAHTHTEQREEPSWDHRCRLQTWRGSETKSWY